MLATLPLTLLALGAVIDVPAGGDLSAALARAGDGDLVRLGPGVHRGSLGRARGPLRVEGAGAELTLVDAPEGEDGLVVDGGAVALSGLAIRGGAGGRAAVKVFGGALALREVALQGGVALVVQGGRVDGREVDLAGFQYGLLAQRGAVALEGGHARGGHAGVALLSGELTLRRYAVTGPATEAGVTVSGGTALLEAVVIRAPGPSGVAVTGSGRVTAAALVVAGAEEHGGALGGCLQGRKGSLAVEGGALSRCAGAALEVSGTEVELRGVDALGGGAGCLVLVDGARAELVGNVCAGEGPSVVAASGARATLRANRWRTDPVLWVDCGSGAAVEPGRGERVRDPCRPRR